MSELALEKVTRELSAIFNPLLQLNDQQQILDLFHDLGYKLPDSHDFGAITGIIDKVGELVTAVEALGDASSDDEKWNALKEILVKIIGVVTAISNKLSEIKTSLNSIPNFLSNSDIDEFPRRVLDYLLIFYLFHHRPKAYGIL